MAAHSNYIVQLEGCRAIFISYELAETAEQALEVARMQLRAPEAKHVHTEVFTGQSLSEVIRG